MFDVSFSELAIIGVVALVVIGPERLPKVARTVGHLMGRAQRYVNDVKADIQREIELDEIRKVKQSLDTATAELSSSLRETESSIRNAGQALQADLDGAAKQAKQALDFASAGDEAGGAGAGLEANVGHGGAGIHSADSSADAQASLPATDLAPQTKTEPPANVTTGTPT